MAKPFPGLAGSIGLLALALAAQVGASFAWIAALGPGADLTLLAGVANLTALVPVAALGFWSAKRRPRWSAAGVRPLWFVALGLTAFGGTIVLGELANLTSALVPLPPNLAQLFNRLTEGPWTISLFTIALVAPLTEELLFRGVLLRGLADRYGAGAGILMTSALFALFHLNVWQALGAFAAGLYLGWIFLRTGSVLYPMLVHGVFNGLPVALAALGFTVTAYNTPQGAGVVEFQPWPWTLAGVVILVTGLVLTKRWSPLRPPENSDTVAP